MKFSILISFIIFSVYSCKEYTEDNNDKNNSSLNSYMTNVIPNVVYNYLSDSLNTPIDALQIYGVNLPSVNVGDPPITNDIYSVAVSMFKVVNGPGQVDYSKLNNNNLTYDPNLFPYRYKSNWWNSGPSLGSDLFWEFSDSSNVVLDTIPVPLSFGNLAFSTNTIDLNNGGSLIWGNTNSGDVIIEVGYFILDSTQKKVTHREIVDFIVTSNNGSYFFTSNQLVNDFNIPLNATKLFFHLVKFNYKLKEYGSSPKSVMSCSFVEQSISVFRN